MSLEDIIKEAVTKPYLKWCTAEVPTHSWMNVWERDVPIWETHRYSTPTKLQPYMRCRYCHARSKDRSEHVADYFVYTD